MQENTFNELSDIRTKKQLKEAIQNALPMAMHYLEKNPNWSIPDSICAQLRFIDSFLSNNLVPTIGERESVILGIQASKEVELFDQPLAYLLSEINYAFRRWDLLT